MFRRHGRTSIRCPMVLKHQKLGYLEVVTSNVSASGIFVGVSSPEDSDLFPMLKIGDRLETQVESANDRAERVGLRVIRQCEDGFGLAFDNS
jgi:PilZ domain